MIDESNYDSEHETGDHIHRQGSKRKAQCVQGVDPFSEEEANHTSKAAAGKYQDERFHETGSLLLSACVKSKSAVIPSTVGRSNKNTKKMTGAM